MSGDSIALEDYSLLNCEFVVCDDIKKDLDVEIGDNIDHLKETPTFYIQQGQYIVPVASSVLLQEPDQKQYFVKEEDECILEDVNQTEQTIIYCTPEQFAAYSEILNKDGELDADSIVVDQVENGAIQHKGVISNMKDISLDDTSELEDSNDSETITKSEPNEEFLEPNYQYAILKDGKLHLQTLNAETVDKSYLKEQLAVLQASISFDNNLKHSGTLDLNKITGKNLITGQTVTLDKYMNKLVASASTFTTIPPKQTRRRVHSNVLNKKVLIGKTSNGKKLIGKIVRVQKAEYNKHNTCNNYKMFEHTKVPKTQHKEYCENNDKSSLTPSGIINTVSNILAGLMNLQSINQKLMGTELVVKLVRSIYNSQDDKFVKSIFLIEGNMENIKEKWCFVSSNVDECQSDLTDDEPDRIDEDDYQQFTNEEEHIDTGKIHNFGNDQKESCTNKVYLTIQIIISENGKTTTKVHFNPRPYIMDQSSNVLEIQIHNNLFGCNECFKTFSNGTLLFQHKKLQHNERWYPCSVCDKKFNSAGSLKRHFTIHNPSLRPLECAVCLQRFTDQSSLKKHLLIHTGIRAFICEICGRSFINQGDLNFHSRIHDPVKQFCCKICGREFSRQSNLLRHEEIHRGESALYQCDICGCSYSFPSSLTRHIVHKHIGNYSENNKT